MDLSRFPSPAAPGGPDDALIERVRQRLLDSIAQDRSPALQTVRADDDAWETFAAGVQRKLLQRTEASASWLLRLQPGARVPAHVHTIDEECVVLDGSLCIGSDIVLKAGDYHLARAGSTHEETTSETGAVVYLRGAPEPAAA